MLGEACALSAALIWSIGVVLFKQSESVSPQGMNLFKNVLAFVLVAATLPLLGVPIDWERSSDDWWRLVLSGVLGIALADTLVFMALRRLGAAMLAVVDCVYAPLIVALSVLVLHEPLTLSFAAGALLVVGGVLAATTERIPLGELAAARRERITGVVLGIAGIAAMAVGVVLAKPVLTRSHLVEVTGVRLAAGLVGQLVWIGFDARQRVALQAFVPSPAWRTLIPASFLGSYVAMFLWLGGFKWASVSVASVLNQLASVFTLILARIVLKEHVSGRKALGAAVAVAGATWVLLTG